MKKSGAQMTQGDAHWERRPGQCKFRILVTVTTTAATAATTTRATAAAAVFPTRPAITAAAAGTIFFRTGDVDRQGAITEVCAVHGFNRLLGFFRGGHGHERET